MSTPRRHRWVLVALGIYAVLAAIVLLTPISFARIVGWIGDVLSDSVGLDFFGSGWIEFTANILMFAPLGFLLTLLFLHPWRGVILALGLSVAAELAQFAIPSRQPSLRDILANALGAAVGAALAWVFVVRPAHRKAARQAVAMDAGGTETG